MHRSGTSALARVFVDAGFDPGQNLMPADEFNQLGYWEDWDIFNLNNTILSKLFVSWQDVENLESRKIHYFANQVIEEFSTVATNIVNEKFARSSSILIKDPRISILLPFWNHVFSNFDAQVAHFHIFRHPLSVAGSLQVRSGISIKNSMLLWYYYNMAFLQDQSLNPVIISYNKLIALQKVALKTLSERAGIDKLEQTAPLSVASSMSHFNESDNEFPQGLFPEIQGLWDWLCRMEENDYAEDRKTGYNGLLVQGIAGFGVENINLEIVVNLVVGKTSERSGNSMIFKGKTISKGFVLFKEITLQHSFSEFSVYVGDKACRVTDPEIVINAGESSFRLKPLSGNYFYAKENEYLFIDNLPEFSFKLPSPVFSRNIEFHFQIEYNNQGFQNKIIPGLYLKNSQLSRLNHHLQNQLTVIGEEKELEIAKMKADFEKQYHDLKIRSEKDKQQLENLRDQLADKDHEIDALEKKSLWLFTEFNKMKASVSWRITAPVRFAECLFHEAGNKLFILVNDAGASLRLLKREGLHSFIGRLKWYLRGKRLKEEIEYFKQKKYIGLSDKLPELPDMLTILHFPESDHPLVSIIIPFYNNIRETYRCLASISKNSGCINYEIILADDHSSDDVSKISSKVNGVVILRNKTNLGFLKTCNTAALNAKGKYLCFLNNDTEVQAGWLEKLVGLLESHDEIAIAGPKLVYPNGRLQEAGGIIWSDATAWNYGRFDDAEKPDYNYLKEVDYVSGACLLIRKSVWEELKGFDEQYAPAYYEDTDLAMQVRQHGKKVFYQPLAVVTHHEGLSNGQDESVGIKRYQAVNRQKFFNKWEKQLKIEFSPNGNNVFFHRDRSLHNKHLLVIDHYVPKYDQDAGSRSTFSYLKLFVKMGFKVHFIGDNYFRHEPYTTVLQQMGVEVLYGSYYQKNIREWFRVNGQYIGFVIAHRVHIAPKYFGMIRKFTHAKIGYVGHDLQYLGSQRKFEVTGKKEFKVESLRFKITETQIFRTVDYIFPFSTYEQPFIKKLAAGKTVKVIPVYFFENIPENVPGFDARKDILFVGYFGHPPNPDAILWFAKEIFPTVQQSIPDVKLHVVGSQPTEEVLRLKCDSINVTGYVSDEDLVKYYRECKVAILPLRFGAGVKGKLLESLYHQIPTVITPVAAEGVPEIENCTLIADIASDYAGKIRMLYQDKNVWEQYSAGGKALVAKYYTEEAARGLLEKIFTPDAHQQIKH